jgi:regulator of ribonuclease activity B
VSGLINEARFTEEWAQDQALLANFADDGDVASVARMLDVSFIGSKAALEPIAEAADALGFAFVQLAPDDDDEADEDQWRLDFDVEQTIEPAAIRALTRKCLKIEATYPGVDYDGWGCMTVTGATS